MSKENKAVGFLEWCDKRRGQRFEDNEAEENRELYEDICKAVDLYSQPFKPEMIVEYFEGVTKESATDYRIGGTGRDETITLYSTGSSGYTNDNKENYYTSGRPLTLDHFITDCQRAGIELDFKQDVINKIFKP